MSVNIYNKTEDKLVPVAGATVYADNPIGSIVPYSGSQPPSGWLICDGRSLSKSNYFDLFKIIGYNFGGSDSTFNIPDLRDKAVMGAGNNGALGVSQRAQLPNITGKIDNKSGTFGILGFSSETGSFSGALKGSEAKGAVYTGQQNTNACKVVTLDASGSGASTDINGNNVYTNNGETRPANVRLNYIIKAKQVAVPADFIDVVKDLIKETTYECSGFLINSYSDKITGFGRATVTLRDGIAKINFSARIQRSDTTDDFTWGLNSDLLHHLIPELPEITPISNNSQLQYFAATGSVLIDLMGYSALAIPTGQFWTPSRMYLPEGSVGSWGSSNFSANSYITGTVYGTYTV